MYHLSIMEVDMPYWKERIDEMTPAERFDRVVEILSRASLRLLKKQQAEAACQNPGEPEAAATADEQLAEPDSTEKAEWERGVLEGQLAIPRYKGRVPFGQRKSGHDRQINEIELLLIKDIQRLAAEGLSSEKIARWLNQKDKVSQRAGKWSRTAVWRILKNMKA